MNREFILTGSKFIPRWANKYLIDQKKKFILADTLNIFVIGLFIFFLFYYFPDEAESCVFDLDYCRLFIIINYIILCVEIITIQLTSTKFIWHNKLTAYTVVDRKSVELMRYDYFDNILYLDFYIFIFSCSLIVFYYSICNEIFPLLIITIIFMSAYFVFSLLAFNSETLYKRNFTVLNEEINSLRSYYLSLLLKYHNFLSLHVIMSMIGISISICLG